MTPQSGLAKITVMKVLFTGGTEDITIRVTPTAGRNEVTREEDGTLRVRVTAQANRGKANKAAIKLLARFFGVKASQVRIVKGEKSRDKIIQVAR